MNGNCAIKDLIENGKTALGIEFGSTRIKAVLLTKTNELAAVGEYAWENCLENGIWTYSLQSIRNGLQGCYADLKKNVESKYGIVLKKTGAIGISAMMHGYLAFGKDGNLLIPFRTWRNTMTEEAANELTELFGYPIPQRWSIAHLYQAVLNNEPHVTEIAYLTTLAGYIHWCLSGEKVIGINDASGMFPIDPGIKDYDFDMMKKFDNLIADKAYTWKLYNILPKPLPAGKNAGFLTKEGALLLDPDGDLESIIPMCPPEGDAGTGMVATNSVQVRTGNVSAGTSVFSMIVLEKKLSRVYPEIDLLTTPEGNLVAMVHCNNCTSDLNAWIELFAEFGGLCGVRLDKNELYGMLYQKALEGDADCGGLLSYNYFSGEHITHFTQGRPLFVREQKCRFNLANFMRTHLCTALGAVKMGNDILLKEENVKVDVIWGHGGFFKTEGVGQRMLASALDTPVSVMKNAGEGGAFGIAILALYMMDRENGQSLAEYLDKKIFQNIESETVVAEKRDVAGFQAFIDRYKKGLDIERAAVRFLA